MDLTEMEIQLEEQFNSHKENKRVEKFFKDIPEFAQVFEQYGIVPKVGYDILVFMALNKRAEPSSIVGHLLHWFNNAQECATYLEAMVKIGLLYWNGQVFIVRFDLTKEIEHEIAMFQFPLPMVVEPMELHKNCDCGYLTIQNESLICKNNYHCDDICLDVLNTQNKIKFRLNAKLADMTLNEWSNLDSQKPDETPAEYQERLKQFQKYDTHARELVKIFANQFFWLTNKDDKRGRMYCQGYYITNQGTDWNKACIEFAKEEQVCTSLQD